MSVQNSFKVGVPSFSEAGQYCFDLIGGSGNYSLELFSGAEDFFSLEAFTMSQSCEVEELIADVLNSNDYYPFGMVMPGRSYQGSDGYRYWFNGMEKDDEVKGNGNSVMFKYRIHDPRIGRFLSSDPLEKEFAFNSPYTYAMNRVIDGIDLEGLEYLDADEARVQFAGGSLELNLDNFIDLNQNAWDRANGNPWNWKPGQIGLSKTIGNISYATQKTETPKTTSLSSDSKKPADQTSFTLKGGNRAGRRQNARQGSPVVSAAPKGGGGAAAGTRLLNAVTFGLQQYGTWVGWYDNALTEEHSLIAQKVMADVQMALDLGVIIPVEYQNSASLGNIANVVLSGVNRTEDEEIYNIGMKIYNTISSPYQSYRPPAPEGADATMVDTYYVVPKGFVEEGENSEATEEEVIK